MSVLRILQYNVQKSKNGVMVPLIDGPQDPYDVVAVQEPWLNPNIDTTYCPRSCPYNLIFPQGGRARTCLLINKRIPISQWRSHEEPDYCWVCIDTQLGPVTLRARDCDAKAFVQLPAVRQPGERVIVGVKLQLILV